MLEEFVGEKIVVDCRSEFVCLGTLKSFNGDFLEMRGADLHDLRDTETTREVYVAESQRTGIKRNRKRLILNRAEVVAIAKLDDVSDE